MHSSYNAFSVVHNMRAEAECWSSASFGPFPHNQSNADAVTVVHIRLNTDTTYRELTLKLMHSSYNAFFVVHNMRAEAECWSSASFAPISS